MKRQRGRGRKSNGQPNRNFESSGPDIKIRGSASNVYDKYQQLARDASSAGDRIAAESYLQHAEHYFRMMRTQQQQQQQQQLQQRDRNDDGGGMRGGFGGPQGGPQGSQPGGQNHGGGYAEPQGANGRDEFDDLGNSGEPVAAHPSSPGPLDVVDPEAADAMGSPGGEQRDDGGGGRRHRRRRRFDGREHQGGASQGGQQGGEGGEARDGASSSFNRAPTNN